MSQVDIGGIVAIITIGLLFGLLFKIIRALNKSDDGVFDFERDYRLATDKPIFKGEKPAEEAIYIGNSQNKKNVFIPSDAR